MPRRLHIEICSTCKMLEHRDTNGTSHDRQKKCHLFVENFIAKSRPKTKFSWLRRHVQ